MATSGPPGASLRLLGTPGMVSPVITPCPNGHCASVAHHHASVPRSRHIPSHLLSHNYSNRASVSHSGVAKANMDALSAPARSDSKTTATPVLLARWSRQRSARPARPGVASDGQPIGHLRGGINSLDCAATAVYPCLVQWHSSVSAQRRCVPYGRPLNPSRP